MNNLPYRDNVCCVTYKGDKFLMLHTKGFPDDFWIFPQGGMDVGETPEQTAMRELKEETGLERIVIKGLSQYENQYDWDDESIKLAGFRWRGQKQRYVVVELVGLKKIHLNPEDTVSDYSWMSKEEMLVVIDHDHKIYKGYKETIMKVLEEFKL
ncbi:hypothetical protein A2368_02150 [Candidatus Collierbacteria bacterium RIFOXYB1_FULL_49_13]|uniref:Nudix hydrolase domain-containing protein n=1 Tax=Candidatus Collierbacteria bacterium RIFOXYB1_FULL_49_13 TaxID=1817728 RepID=A0A1F5FGL5_9BACT|nr:MAG: hypothetical protein A2368_02150 [Candidatus Collierbacteria bacterium RIFOXYB1_FULL_49_13]